MNYICTELHLKCMTVFSMHLCPEVLGILAHHMSKKCCCSTRKIQMSIRNTSAGKCFFTSSHFLKLFTIRNIKTAEKNSLFSKFFTAVFMFLIMKSFKKYVHSKFTIFDPPPPCLFLFVLHVPPPTLPPPST